MHSTRYGRQRRWLRLCVGWPGDRVDRLQQLKRGRSTFLFSFRRWSMRSVVAPPLLPPPALPSFVIASCCHLSGFVCDCVFFLSGRLLICFLVRAPFVLFVARSWFCVGRLLCVVCWSAQFVTRSVWPPFVSLLVGSRPVYGRICVDVVRSGVHSLAAFCVFNFWFAACVWPYLRRCGPLWCS